MCVCWYSFFSLFSVNIYSHVNRHTFGASEKITSRGGMSKAMILDQIPGELVIPHFVLPPHLTLTLPSESWETDPYTL